MEEKLIEILKETNAKIENIIELKAQMLELTDGFEDEDLREVIDNSTELTELAKKYEELLDELDIC